MLNNRFRRTLALALGCLTLIGALSACSSTDNSEKTPAATTAANVTAPTTTDTDAVEPTPVEITRENYPDTLPPELRFDGRTFTMLVRSDSNRRDEFIADGLTGEVVNDATLAREQTVENRFGIDIEWMEEKNSAMQTTIRNMLNSGLIDFDLVGAETDHIVTLGAEGLFMNWIDAPYLDFSQPWWNADANMVDALSINGKLYGITGDLSRLFVQKHGCVFFNKAIMADYPAIPDLYEMVLEGKWTLEQMIGFGALVKEDLNGDQVMNEEDRYGLCSYYATPFDNWIIALGQSVAVKNEEGIPEFTLDTQPMYDLCDLLTDFYHSDTTFIHSGSKAGSIKFFAENHCLFTVGGFEWATDMREMTNDFGIIPYPKLNEQQEGYYTGYSDVGTSCFAIPEAHGDQEFVCAVTEALAAESYRKVTTAYFETALKEKYARDSISSQMLDMIREGIVFDFGFYYNSQLRECATMMRTVVANGNKRYASHYDTISRVYEKMLETLLAKYE